MIEFYTLLWENISTDFWNAHSTVMNHFKIPINYTRGNYDHGSWMDYIMEHTTQDYVGFFDIDCVPVSREAIENCIEYVRKNDNFLGCAQSSNHIPPFTHTFAAPSFFIISRKCWLKMGKPSFTQRIGKWDVAEGVSYSAEEQSIRYRCLYPDFFEREPIEGVWRLHNYGLYGIGTLFDDTVYHLYQGRANQNSDLFIKRCEEIVSGKFFMDGFNKSRNWDYEGRIVK